MASDKKSFILYCDQKGLWDKLDDAQAGKLIKHIIAYVNDENPAAPDFITELAFEPIKQQLKRDLQLWSETRQSRRTAGKAGAEARWHPMANDGKRMEPMAKMAVNDNVNVNVTDNVTVIVNDTINTAADTATNKSEAFMQRLIPYVDTYGKDMMREFFNYWTEKNEGGKKMRFEMQKVFDVSRRLSTWSERAKNNKFNTNGKPTYKTVNEQINNL